MTRAVTRRHQTRHALDLIQRSQAATRAAVEQVERAKALVAESRKLLAESRDLRLTPDPSNG